MKLSAPIHILKAQAQLLKKEKSMTNTQALDFIANREGFDSWSLLQSKKDDMFPKNYDEILGFFNTGDIVLIGARATIGKTVFTTGLFVQAIQKTSAINFYFSLASDKDIAKRMMIYDESINEKSKFFEINYSNLISADYIIEKIKNTVAKNSLIVIDCLQSLDEKIGSTSLQSQIGKLKNFAREKECVIVFISQINRALESKEYIKPTMADINLPDTIELKFFNKIILLHKQNETASSLDVLFYRPKEFSFIVGWDQSFKFHSI